MTPKQGLGSVAHDLCASGPLVVKYDIKGVKSQARGLGITCDQKVALFNISRHLYLMEIKDILSCKSKDKLKVGWTQLP